MNDSWYLYSPTLSFSPMWGWPWKCLHSHFIRRESEAEWMSFSDLLRGTQLASCAWCHWRWVSFHVLKTPFWGRAQIATSCMHSWLCLLENILVCPSSCLSALHIFDKTLLFLLLIWILASRPGITILHAGVEDWAPSRPVTNNSNRSKVGYPGLCLCPAPFFLDPQLFQASVARTEARSGVCKLKTEWNNFYSWSPFLRGQIESGLSAGLMWLVEKESESFLLLRCHLERPFSNNF